CVESGWLIAPGAVERMLADREKLDMGEAEVARIGWELLGELAIGQPFIAALASPGAEMHFVYRDRSAQRVDVRRGRPRTRDPGFVEYDGSGLGPHFGGKRQRLGFERQRLALRACDVELVVIADPGARGEKLPIAWGGHPPRMAARLPEIEIADPAAPPCIRCEHHEGDAVDAVKHQRMRAELVVEPLIGPFAEQIEIEVAQDRREAIGVLQLDDVVAELGA